MSFMEKVDLWLKRYLAWIMAGVSILALFLRFIHLGTANLADREAELALQALSIARGQQTLIGGSPGYVGLTSMLFFLFGGSDFFARFWPALFGSALVLTPLLFRRHLDDMSVVMLCFLLALEPGLVAVSRTADGLAMTLFSVVAAAGFLMNRKTIPAGVFAGLALVSSPAFWPLILVLALAGFLTNLAAKGLTEEMISQVQIQRPGWLRFVAAAVITLVLTTTIFLQHPAGISGIASGFTEFLVSWRQSGNLPFGSFLMILLVTQLPALILGLWGLFEGLREKRSIVRFFGLWWILGLINWSLNPSLAEQHIVLINAPLYVLTILQIVRLFQKFTISSKLVALVETTVTLSLLVFSSINLLNLTNVLMGDPVAERNRLIGTLLPLLLWVIFTILLAWGWDTPSTKGGLLLAFGVLGLILLLGSGWKAAGLGSQPENEFLRGSEYTTGEESLLTTISDLSRWNTGQANCLDVKVAGLQVPSLVWSLRDFEKLSIDSTFHENANASVILAQPDSLVRSESVYRGTSLMWSVSPDYAAFTWKDWVKWFFLRSSPQTKTDIMIWVRNDLFKDYSPQDQDL